MYDVRAMDAPRVRTVIRWHRVAAALVCAFVATTWAQTDISKLGPAVGGNAIDFQLLDQFGHPQTLKSVAGPKGTMLVFFRSADW
jgi:hypothetical protein